MKLPDDILRQFFICEPKDKTKTDGVSVIITVRGTDRINQMYHCVQWAINQTLAPLEVLVVENDSSSKVDITKFKEFPEVRYLFIQNDGAFCKSACYNHGVSNAKYENICGIDADLLMPTDFLMSGYMQLLKNDACFLADDIFYLKGVMADMFDFNFSGQTWQTHRANWQFHGGSFFIKKQKYYDIGGHDENFLGHGSEDSEFYKRVHDLLKVSSASHTVLHMEHGREESDFVNIERNKLYLYNVQNNKLSDRILYLRRNNYYLTGEQLVHPTTNIPQLFPISLDDDGRLKKLRSTQAQREALNRSDSDKNSPAVIKNANEIRRRRVLGF